jgi:SAM-dependent methyltransferase
MSDQEVSGYDAGYMPIMDLVWGKGFIAPGGEGNVDRIVRDVELRGKSVLELGSGAGGGTLVLAGKYGAKVVGLELEASLVEISNQLAEEAGLSDQLEFRCVEPGPLPVADASFDFLYTSGVICHIEDRLGLFKDILRVLKPGGSLLGYDWFPTCLSDDIQAWLKAADLHLFQDTPQNYARVMGEAGFEQVTSEDASSWYLKQAATELELLTGPQFELAAELTSAEIRDQIIQEWEAMNRVLQSGELRSGYFRGSKPI